MSVKTLIDSKWFKSRKDFKKKGHLDLDSEVGDISPLSSELRKPLR